MPNTKEPRGLSDIGGLGLVIFGCGHDRTSVGTSFKVVQTYEELLAFTIKSWGESMK